MKRYSFLIALIAFLSCGKDGGPNNPPPPPPSPEITITAVNPAKADGGTVTISGTSFGNQATGTTVKFGDKTATIKTITPTEIVVDLPTTLTSGFYDVSVTVAAKTATKTTAFQFIAWMVSSFAGTGQQGNDNGAGAQATFINPVSVMPDDHGNLYVCDNHRIRKISPTGVVSQFAGSGVSGLLNGTSANARFNFPVATAIDGLGNIYVSDHWNHSIRMIDPNGMVTTVAGTGLLGNTNGNLNVASFTHPHGIYVNPEGTLMYVADQGNNMIRKIDLWSGVVSDFAPAETPSGICVSKNGDVFVTEKISGHIKKINPAGTLVTTIHSFGPQVLPYDIKIDDDNTLYIVCQASNQVKRLRPNLPTATTMFGQALSGSDDGPALQAKFLFPTGLCFVPDQGGLKFFIADASNRKIRMGRLQ